VDGRTKSGHDGAGLNFPDPKRQQFFVLAAVFKRIAGLAQKIWNIDSRKWIGALDNQNVARLRLSERFASPERRQWAFEAAQIERLFGHRRDS
jgi:hypothetical protein